MKEIHNKGSSYRVFQTVYSINYFCVLFGATEAANHFYPKEGEAWFLIKCLGPETEMATDC